MIILYLSSLILCISNVSARYVLSSKSSEPSIQDNVRELWSYHYDKYLTFPQMESRLQLLEKTYPELVSVKVVGQSVEKRNLYLVTITKSLQRKQESDADTDKKAEEDPQELEPSDDKFREARRMPINFDSEIDSQEWRRVAAPLEEISRQDAGSVTGPKPVIFVDGGIHAREWASPSAALYIIDQIIKDPTLTEAFEWRIMPIVNPDGYAFSSKARANRFWRKNRKETSQANCNGVDLNRNFDVDWKSTVRWPCSQVYGGTSAFSEPESRALRDAINDVKHVIKAYVTIHSYGQYILYPYGYSKKHQPENLAELKSMAEGMAQEIYDSYRTRYRVGSASILGEAAGGSDDWAHMKAKVDNTFLIEMKPKSGRGIRGFDLPASDLQQAVDEVWLATSYLARNLRLQSINKKLRSDIAPIEATLDNSQEDIINIPNSLKDSVSVESEKKPVKNLSSSSDEIAEPSMVKEKNSVETSNEETISADLNEDSDETGAIIEETIIKDSIKADQDKIIEGNSLEKDKLEVDIVKEEEPEKESISVVLPLDDLGSKFSSENEKDSVLVSTDAVESQEELIAPSNFQNKNSHTPGSLVELLPVHRTHTENNPLLNSEKGTDVFKVKSTELVPTIVSKIDNVPKRNLEKKIDSINISEKENISIMPIEIEGNHEKISGDEGNPKEILNKETTHVEILANDNVLNTDEGNIDKSSFVNENPKPILNKDNYPVIESEMAEIPISVLSLNAANVPIFGTKNVKKTVLTSEIDNSKENNFKTNEAILPANSEVKASELLDHTNQATKTSIGSNMKYNIHKLKEQPNATTDEEKKTIIDNRENISEHNEPINVINPNNIIAPENIDNVAVHQQVEVNVNLEDMSEPQSFMEEKQPISSEEIAPIPENNLEKLNVKTVQTNTDVITPIDDAFTKSDNVLKEVVISDPTILKMLSSNPIKDITAELTIPTGESKPPADVEVSKNHVSSSQYETEIPVSKIIVSTGETKIPTGESVVVVSEKSESTGELIKVHEDEQAIIHNEPKRHIEKTEILADEATNLKNNVKYTVEDDKAQLKDIKISAVNEKDLDDETKDFIDEQTILSDETKIIDNDFKDLIDETENIEGESTIEGVKGDAEHSAEEDKVHLDEAKISLVEDKVQLDEAQVSLVEDKVQLDEAKVSLVKDKVIPNDAKDSIDKSEVLSYETKHSNSEPEEIFYQTKVLADEDMVSKNDAKPTVEEAKFQNNKDEISRTEVVVITNKDKDSNNEKTLTEEDPIADNNIPVAEFVPSEGDSKDIVEGANIQVDTDSILLDDEKVAINDVQDSSESKIITDENIFSGDKTEHPVEEAKIEKVDVQIPKVEYEVLISEKNVPKEKIYASAGDEKVKLGEFIDLVSDAELLSDEIDSSELKSAVEKDVSSIVADLADIDSSDTAQEVPENRIFIVKNGEIKSPFHLLNGRVSLRVIKSPSEISISTKKNDNKKDTEVQRKHIKNEHSDSIGIDNKNTDQYGKVSETYLISQSVIQPNAGKENSEKIVAEPSPTRLAEIIPEENPSIELASNVGTYDHHSDIFRSDVDIPALRFQRTDENIAFNHSSLEGIPLSIWCRRIKNADMCPQV